MDKLQGARNNEAPVLGRTPEIRASRGYKSRGTRPSRFVKRPIDVSRELVRPMMRVPRKRARRCESKRDDAKGNNAGTLTTTRCKNNAMRETRRRGESRRRETFVRSLRYLPAVSITVRKIWGNMERYPRRYSKRNFTPSSLNEESCGANTRSVFASL